MNSLKAFIKYFIYLIRKKIKVAKYCFYARLYWRGITHDLSLFNPFVFCEFAKCVFLENYKITFKYHEALIYCRNHNDYHWDYWLFFDYTNIKCIAMPYEPFVELICDLFAESKSPIDAIQYWYYEMRPNAPSMNKITMKNIDKVMDFLKESDSFKETCKNLKNIYHES